MIIDFDTISYSGISGSSFTGVSGVDSSHSSGQYLFVSNHEYLFAFGAGPVGVAGPVYVNGAAYADCTIYKDRNPVQVGFMGGFPHIDNVSNAGQIIKEINISDSDFLTYGNSYKVLNYSDYGVRISGNWPNQKIAETKSFGIVIPQGNTFVSASASFSDALITDAGGYFTINATIRLLGVEYYYSCGYNSITYINKYVTSYDKSSILDGINKAIFL